MLERRSNITVVTTLAIVLGLASLITNLNPQILGTNIPLLLIGVTLVVIGIVVIVRIIEFNNGIPCPVCRHRGLQRKAITSFGHRFYLCNECGARCQRGMFAMSNDDWTDASDARFDIHYATPTPPPLEPAPLFLDDDEENLANTHSKLLAGKRQRQPENPNLAQPE